MYKLEDGDSFEEILKGRSEISDQGYILEILSSFPSLACILNENNDIVFSNTAMLEKYNIDLEENILGSRPGDFFNCVNVNKATGGCGTSEKCQYCGANNAFGEAWRSDMKVMKECRIVTLQDGHFNQLDLEISATPIQFEKRYLLVSIRDVTEEKRKALLERIFFHDIINIAGGLSGMLDLLSRSTHPANEEYVGIAKSLTGMIIDEIRGQQQLIKAENGELEAVSNSIVIERFLVDVADQVRFHSAAIDKQIDVDIQTKGITIFSDRSLLARVLINMAKNAFEATLPGKSIILKAQQIADNVRLSVHNSEFIPNDVQAQIFSRFFSTKGKDRGFGTYSMKLLGERYLNGNVNFTSDQTNGTTFFIDLPIE